MVKALHITLIIACSCGGVAWSDQPVAVKRPDNDSIVLPGEAMTFRRISPRNYGTNSPDFFLLETEVSNEMYALYLKATRRAKGDQEVADAERKRRASGETWGSSSPIQDLSNVGLLWTNNSPPAGLGKYPVALLTIQDANNFCQWLTQRYPALGHFRLPTEQEWMLAAYGDKRSYPWGTNWDIRIPYVSPSESSAHVSPVAVDSPTQDITPEGIRHLWGNVREYIDEPSWVELVWMGESFKSYPREKQDESFSKPRRNYFGFAHNRGCRSEQFGFRVLLEPPKNNSNK